jgi:hypothetical protein
MSEEEIVPVERYSDVIQAQFALSVLAGSGIDAFLDVPHTAAMFPHYALATGGVSLLVRASELERAREVLAEMGEPEP